jgi:protoporphyrinogen/coproporphyrinogen III oxidase
MTINDVIVIGAGPSGLAAAYRLHQAGMTVRVLEKAGRIGGKMSTATVDGFILDQGALLLPTTYRALFALAEEAGLGDQIVPGGFILGEMRDGSVHDLDGEHLLSSVLRSKLLSTSCKLEALKLLPDVIRARKANFQHMPECGRYDFQTIAEWVEGKFSDELKNYLIGAVMRGIFATRLETASRVDFLAILNLFGGARLVGFRDGMQSYADKLAEPLEVQCNAEVQSVEEDADGVTVVWRDGNDEHTERTGGCVIALPAVTTRAVYSGLDGWRQYYLQRVRHGKSMVLSIALKRAPQTLSSTYILIPESEHPFIAGIMLDHNKLEGRAPPGKGLLSVTVMDFWCEENWQRSDAELEEELISAVLSLLPDIKNDIEFVRFHRWFLEYNQVGHYRELAEFRALCNRDRRVQLAGDFHSMGGLNPATIAGLNAADRMLAIS